MTVETTIQCMFDQCPELFATRQECYNFLFCAIGNGYEWKRGQIVYIGDGEENRNIQMWEEMDYADQAAKHTVARQTEENIKKHDAILRRAGVKKPFWYPFCEYSLINRVPEKVKPDWLLAASECRMMLRKNGIEIK